MEDLNEKKHILFQIIVISLVLVLTPSLYAYDEDPESLEGIYQYPPTLKKEIQKKISSIEALKISIEDLKSSIAQMEKEIKAQDKKSALYQKKKEIKGTTIPRKSTQTAIRRIKTSTSKTTGPISTSSDCSPILDSIVEKMLTLIDLRVQLNAVEDQIEEINDLFDNKEKLTDEEIDAFGNMLSKALEDLQKIEDEISNNLKDIKNLENAFSQCIEKNSLSDKASKDYEKKLKSIQIKPIQFQKR
jgi:FtsZ-binding cell division protein ZapB